MFTEQEALKAGKTFCYDALSGKLPNIDKSKASCGYSVNKDDNGEVYLEVSIAIEDNSKSKAQDMPGFYVLDDSVKGFAHEAVCKVYINSEQCELVNLY